MWVHNQLVAKVGQRQAEPVVEPPDEPTDPCELERGVVAPPRRVIGKVSLGENVHQLKSPKSVPFEPTVLAAPSNLTTWTTLEHFRYPLLDTYCTNHRG